MKNFIFGQNQFKFSYLLMVILFFITVIIAKTIALTPWSLSVVFAGVLLIPGFSLARIFEINFENDKLGRVILWLSVGLIFSLIICFAAMIAGLSINTVSMFYPFLMGGLLILAFILDSRRPIGSVLPKPKFVWKDILTIENFILTFAIIMALIGLMAIVDRGSLLKGGDPNYHISIIEKAFEGASLKPSNLGFIKSETSHIAYGLPVWHVFLALLAKLQNTDVLVVWKTISTPLSIFSLLVWYWLALKIFNNRFFASLALIFYLLHIFNLNNGYYFTCLPLPDTFNTFLLFPLAISLGLKYIFDKTTNLKLLVIVALAVIFMAVIHLTQYFYFLMALFSFTLVWLATQWKNPDFKFVLIRVFLLFSACFLIFLPLVGLLELKSHIISHTLKTMLETNEIRDLRYSQFAYWDIFFQYTYLAAPLILLFVKKQPRLVFLFGLLIITPIAYIKPVSVVLIKFLDYILVNRLLGSITWNYFVFALIFGFIILLVDRLVSKLSFSKVWEIGLNALLIAATVLFIFLQIKYGFAALIYQKVFSESTELILSKYHFLISGIVILVTIILWIISNLRSKFADLFELTGPKNFFVPVCLIISLIMIFVSANYATSLGYIGHVRDHNSLFGPSNLTKYKKDTISGVGGQSMVDFIKLNIPQKSVLIIPGSAIQTLPMLVDQFMAAYPRTGKLNRALEIYSDNIGHEDKLKLINEFKIEYILLYKPENQGEAYFDSHQNNYKKIFKDRAVIYKVLN